MENKIQTLLEEIKNESFTKGYTATDQEAMGLLISHYFHWDGIKILESTYNALEDANFHTENEKIADMITNLKKYK